MRGSKTVLRVLCAVLCMLTLLPGVTARGETFSGAEYEDIAVDPVGSSDGYSAVLYDNTNGLPTSESNAIAETAEGFIWIGSYSGLIRYDGNTFERIDSTTGITSTVSLYVDSRNRLWIGTNDNGAAVMDRGELRMYGKAEGLKSMSVRSIAEDDAGNVYIATTHGMAVVDANMEMHAVDEPQINESYIWEIRMGSDGLIYGVTSDGAVFTMKDGKLTGFHEGSKLGVEDIMSVLPDPARPGWVYLGTERSEIIHGELESGLQNAERIDVSPLVYVNSMEHFGDQLWVCSDNGVGVVENGVFRKANNIPMNNSVDHMMADYEGNLWFTSSRQGVMKVVPNQFTDVFARYELPAAVVNSTCMYNGLLFIGTDKGLTVLDGERAVAGVPLSAARTASGKTLAATDLMAMLQGVRIRSIVRDNDGGVWLSTYSEYGLVRYDGDTVTTFSAADGMPSDRMRTVCQRQDGAIMAVGSGGLTLIRDGRVESVYGETSGLSNTEILTVTEAGNGDMLLGSDGDGIYVIRDTKVIHLGTEAGLTSGVVMRLKYDAARDLFWIVTSNSIAYMTSDYQITTVREFPYSNNFDLYENSQNEMWVLSSNGVYVTATEELLANGDINPVYLSRDNGLSCVPTANSYSEVTEDGELYIAGSTGVARVNTETPFASVGSVKMAVPYVEADGVQIYADDNGVVTVPPGVRRLTIYSYVYTYSLMNPKVTYHLEGFDTESVTVNRSDLEPVDYTNLTGGSYQFVMQLRDPLGHSIQELSVPIVKQKAVHELLWFRVLCVAAGLALLATAAWLYTNHKTKVLVKKARENKMFIREMTQAFAKTIDMKDAYTNGHSTRVANYTAMLAKELGYDEETVEKYYNIALLHDIGKIGIPAEVLNKPGKLTEPEFQMIKSHSALGYRVLKDISIMPELAIGAGAHHERPDGKGYPKGLTGSEIPRVAQIIAVADTFDAMYSDRPYRKRMNFERAVSIIREASGTQLTPDVVDAFLRLVSKGLLRAPDDHGGGSMEDISNISARREEG